MEKEKQYLQMLDAIRSNAEFYRLLLTDIAFAIMVEVYPEYEATSRKIFFTNIQFGGPPEHRVASVDYLTEKNALNFVNKLVNLGSLEAIKEYCSTNKISEYYPPNEAEYIRVTYEEMNKKNN